MLNLNGKSVLVTGGTGSFGKKFISTLLDRFPKVKRVVVYSRDELKQFEMAQQFSTERYKALRYFIGDIRDGDRFRRACEGIDVIVHAAALKQVPAAEYNPIECIKTNILGAQNVIEAAMETNVECVVALSTDKAAAPINLYGATKLCSDKLFVAANNMRGSRKLRYSVVRYGNVIGSRGSVIPFFLNKRKEGFLPITDPNMTRFTISLDDGVRLVMFAIEHAIGGEIFIPKIPSYKLSDVAKAIGPECEHRITGIRPGEKMHEEMITIADAPNTIEIDNYFIICPSNLGYLSRIKEDYLRHYNGKSVPNNFTYNSGENKEWLNVEAIREEIRQHVDPNFMVNTPMVANA
ncbi:MAG: UDP-N-acetylglucosamine 4,6-dehydratase (inverting) [Bacteroidota bacterium]